MAAFYDLQVADTNNYVTADGTIHHNSGKSHALCVWLLLRKLRHPKQHVAYYMPTYDLIRMIGRPRIIELLEQWGIPYRENKVENRVKVGGAGDVIFRNMDRPERIVGYETADSVIDELDTLPLAKAQEVWRKVVARNRQKKPGGGRNQIGIGTTPEGFRFTYQRWSKAPTPHHAIVHASTYANAHNLPDDYIQSLIDDYPPELLAAYLDGRFVNLAQGRVYTSYERERCRTDRAEPKPWKYRQGGRLLEAGEELHIGMDFNVQRMAAVVGVDCWPGAKGLDIIGEFSGLADTPAMIEAIKARYPIIDGKERLEGWPADRIVIYPDATSASTGSTNASTSDLALLKQAGFRVKVQPANPRIKDRVISVNGALAREDDNPRRVRINPDTCPVLVEALENQPYTDKGEPDKSLNYDHQCLSGDTLIATPFGPRPIADLAALGQVAVSTPYGDAAAWITCTNPEAELLEVQMEDGAHIKATSDHPFLTDAGWMPAGELEGRSCYNGLLFLQQEPVPCQQSRQSSPPPAKSSTAHAGATARRGIAGSRESITRQELARIAMRHSRSIAMRETTTAAGSARQSPALRRVVAVRWLAHREPAYNMVVPGVGAYLLADGAVSSNCDALGYLAWNRLPVRRREASHTWLTGG